jgi:uncharacterized membrane protein
MRDQLEQLEHGREAASRLPAAAVLDRLHVRGPQRHVRVSLLGRKQLINLNKIIDLMILILIILI